MKLTESRLKQLIKEQLDDLMVAPALMDAPTSDVAGAGEKNVVNALRNMYKTRTAFVRTARNKTQLKDSDVGKLADLVMQISDMESLEKLIRLINARINLFKNTDASDRNKFLKKALSKDNLSRLGDDVAKAVDKEFSLSNMFLNLFKEDEGE